MAAWLEPTPGVSYGAIVAAQSIGCVACLLLFVLQYLASFTPPDTKDKLGVKDSGYWLVAFPFFPAVAFYGLLWRKQRSRSEGVGGVDAGGCADRDECKKTQ